jgi:uncharacterized membrane protein YgdD (TMEM256/DUF423 family)
VSFGRSPLSVWLFAGALNGFLVVALGAFGAHALKDRLGPELLTTYETGVRYHAYHALALLLVGLWAQGDPDPRLQWAGALMTVGIVLFSGSLYALALSRVRMLGMVTPLGGVSFLVAWALLAWRAVR